MRFVAAVEVWQRTDCLVEVSSGSRGEVMFVGSRYIKVRQPRYGQEWLGAVRYCWAAEASSGAVRSDEVRQGSRVEVRHGAVR